MVCVSYVDWPGGKIIKTKDTESGLSWAQLISISALQGIGDSVWQALNPAVFGEVFFLTVYFFFSALVSHAFCGGEQGKMGGEE